jgi:hypothetical protein
VAEIGPVLAHLPKGLQHLVGRGVLQHVTGRAHFKRATHDDGIGVHGENQNRRLLVVQAKPPDKRQAAKRARAHGKVDDDHVRLLGAMDAESIGQTAVKVPLHLRRSPAC